MSKPLVFEGQTVFCDIDDTLVSWERYNQGQYEEGMIGFVDPDDGKTYYLDVIHENVEAIRRHKLRGHIIVLWSQGGAEWCHEVAKKLNLENTVDLYIRKPVWYYDDLPAGEFMPESIRKHNRLKK